MVRGEVPYRDFKVEYPPGALPVFLLPSLGHGEDAAAYRRAFETLMAALGAVLVIVLGVALAALRAPPRRLYGSLALAGTAPLLVGSVVLSRFDLWPAALVAAALALLVSGRLRLGHAVLGLGIVAKLWPGVLLPLGVAHAWRTRGRREALTNLALSLGVVAAVVLPFVVLSPSGVWRSVEGQLTRPLQIESVGAALIVAAHHVLGTGAVMVGSHGSQNIDGTPAAVVGGVQTLLQLAVLVGLWIGFARRRRNDEELVRYSAAAIVAFVALGKVLSPQFAIWLFACVPLVRGLAPKLLLALALVLTQAEFPQRYWPYALEFNETTSWLVLVRDLVLVALLVSLARPLSTPSRSR
jgi:hypothetical protein